MPREKSKGQNPKDESTDAENRGGAACSSKEVPVMGRERRGCVIQFYVTVNREKGRSSWIRQSRLVFPSKWYGKRICG